MHRPNPIRAMGIGTDIEAPLIIGFADATHWDHAADVMIVGYGGAGICGPGSAGAGPRAARLFAKAGAIERSIGVTRLIRASCGVCLSAGGFIFYRAMVAHFASKYPRPVRHAPFHAINLSIDAELGVLPVLTLGGLTIADESGAVLDGVGVPIAGLYAAGRTAVCICSNIYVSGLSVADCVFSGRRTAQSMAA